MGANPTSGSSFSPALKYVSQAFPPQSRTGNGEREQTEKNGSDKKQQKNIRAKSTTEKSRKRGAGGDEWEILGTSQMVTQHLPR
jgi:hypothetical protein